MAKIRNEEDLDKPDHATVFDHCQELEKRLLKSIRIIDKCHKINWLHKFKEKWFKKSCEICKEIGEIR